MFGADAGRQSLKSYRKKGLGDLSRRMVDAVVSRGVEGARVLDIGGGIGALQAEIVAAGADRGEVVELVGGYEESARELARDLGLEGRVTYRVADLLESPIAAEPADVVILNRVVCCSPDGVELTAAAARLTRRTLVMSFPRDAVWVRAAVRLMNAGLWAMRRSFRVFVHPVATLIATAEGQGLEVVEGGRDSFWQYVAFARQ